MEVILSQLVYADYTEARKEMNSWLAGRIQIGLRELVNLPLILLYIATHASKYLWLLIVTWSRGG